MSDEFVTWWANISPTAAGWAGCFFSANNSTSVPINTVITFTAQPRQDRGWFFDHWEVQKATASGSYYDSPINMGTNPTLQLLMDTNYLVRAVFTQTPPITEPTPTPTPTYTPPPTPTGVTTFTAPDGNVYLIPPENLPIPSFDSPAAALAWAKANGTVIIYGIQPPIEEPETPPYYAPPKEEQPPPRTFAARVPMMPILVLILLKKMRDALISKKVHEKLHPVV